MSSPTTAGGRRDDEDEDVFGLRPFVARSSRQRVDSGPMYASIIQPVRPFTGVQIADAGPPAAVEGRTRPAPPPGSPDPRTAAAVTDAGAALLDGLTADQRDRVTHPVDSEQWQTWLNTHPNILRHGLLLEELTDQQRHLVTGLMRASLSERGYQQARDIMRINGHLVELSGRAEEFGEWPYFVSVFGTPGLDRPWGWQLDGHHLVLNVVVVNQHVVTTPAFMGSEPCAITSGPLAGTRVLRPEHDAGLRFMRSLDAHQRPTATTRPSIRTADLPPELLHPVNGRVLSGPFRDNVVIPHEGVRGADLTPTQRSLLLSAISTYLEWSPDTTAAVRRALASELLDETSFSWMGEVADRGPFYYRILGPSVLIEFDHHAGTVFDNPDPTPNHIHTMVRTPLGGDYGVDLIRQHHERWDHSTGRHTPWT
ncbi:DUF3500 domain-containing protein [Kineococcus sp. LSe6-4]|uniref:DUF3500 domain-containing protein n=1 Tax=Kineococcus halophytocola TaxID=3234027 RepID=A0ABV4H247_9ACTN